MTRIARCGRNGLKPLWAFHADPLPNFTEKWWDQLFHDVMVHFQRGQGRAPPYIYLAIRSDQYDLAKITRLP